MKFRNIYLQFIVLIILLVPVFVSADYIGQRADFYIDPDFGKTTDYRISATLQADSLNNYFYVDDRWLNSKTESEKKDIKSILNSLGSEFTANIYPKLTAIYGSEWNPGIDGDRKITVLFYPMKEEARGYVRNIDEYEKTVMPFSNQREIIYLNVDTLGNSLINDYLAHEFTHIIQFNQKEKKLGISEETWLNEMRAEYAPTLLGYNDLVEEDNYLRKRVTTFLNNPFDSLIEWKEEMSDYGVVSIFGHYLVDQYGIEILSDSLKSSSRIGIDSINEILEKRGIKDKFSDIFVNWTIASYLNDCSSNTRYCYKNKNLTSVHIVPFNNFIPFTGESTLSVSQTISNWSAHWQKFSGANKTLTLVFDGRNQNYFKVLYIIRGYSDAYEVKELKLDVNNKGEIVIPNMGIDKSSVMVIPIMENSNLTADNNSDFYYSIAAAATIDSNSNENIDNNDNNDIKLPFAIDKPISQMNREELLLVLIRVIIYLFSQGRLTF